jgi:hypothetical protein
MKQDFIGIESGLQRGHDLAAASVHPEQGLEVVATDRDGEAIDVDDFDHAAAGGDAAQGVDLARASEGEAVGVRMRISGIDGFHRDTDAGFLKNPQ